MAAPQPSSTAQDAAIAQPPGLLAAERGYETSMSQISNSNRSHHSLSPTHGTILPSPQAQAHHQNQLPPPQTLGQPQHPTHQGQGQQRSVKRPRPVKSCTECRKRKLRCDRLCPCSQCQKSNRSCKYAIDQDSANLSDGSDVEMNDPNRPSKRNRYVSNSGAGGIGIDGAPPVRNGDASGLPVLEELSMRMERLEKQLKHRSPAGTESGIGSGIRLITAPAETQRGLSVKDGATRTRLFGQNEPRVMLNLVSRQCPTCLN